MSETIAITIDFSLTKLFEVEVLNYPNNSTIQLASSFIRV